MQSSNLQRFFSGFIGSQFVLQCFTVWLQVVGLRWISDPKANEVSLLSILFPSGVPGPVGGGAGAVGKRFFADESHWLKGLKPKTTIKPIKTNTITINPIKNDHFFSSPGAPTRRGDAADAAPHGAQRVEQLDDERDAYSGDASGVWGSL